MNNVAARNSIFKEDANEEGGEEDSLLNKRRIQDDQVLRFTEHGIPYLEE